MSLEPTLQRVVNLLKYDHKSPVLNDRIKRVMGKNHTPAGQFKIKQEIVRLAKPCRRVLDFSNKMTGVDIDRVDFNDMLHYLDRQSAEELKKEYARYADEYTMGVYEHVTHFFESNKQELIDAQEGLKADIKFVRLAYTLNRREERMHLATPVSIARLKEPNTDITADFVPNDDNLDNALTAVTSDISNSALSVRTRQHIKPSEYIAVAFDGLAKDLIFKQQYVLYKAIKILLEENGYKVILKLEEIASNQEFAEYSKNLIYSHKHKYKVNTDNILDSVTSKALEQYQWARSRALYLYIDENAKLKSMLYNDQGEDLFDYFGRDKASYLPALFDKDKFDAIKQLQAHPAMYYLINKTSKDGSPCFQSMIFDGSAESISMLAEVIRQPEGRVLKLAIGRCDAHTALIRTAVPEDAQRTYGSCRIHRYSNKLSPAISSLNQVISINNISLPEELVALLPAAEQKSETLGIKPTSIQSVCAYSHDRRSEDRFEVSTTLRFYYEGKEYRTKTRNASVLGLAIKVGALRLNIGTTINVTFDDFVERTQNFNLQKCIYKVVHCEDGVARLSNRDSGENDARQFWERFIMERIDSFRIENRPAEIYGLNRSLKNLAASRQPDAIAYFNFKQHKPNVMYIALPHNKEKHPLWATPNKQMEHIFKTWFYAPGVIRPLMLLCEQFKAKQELQRGLLFIAHKFSQNKIEIVTSRMLSYQQNQIGQLPNLIKLYQKRGCELSIMSLTMERTDPEYSRYYLDELNYLNRFAKHKSQELSKRLRSVTAMLTFRDITTLLVGALGSK